MVASHFTAKLGFSLREGGFSANSLLTSANALNVTNQVNTASLFATANLTVGANVLIDTGTINVGNSTANLFVNSTVMVLGNTIVNATINSTAFSGRAANSLALNGKADTYFTNADNLASGTVPAARLTSSSTSTAGIVQLSDSTISTSITVAATANAVKTAFDLAQDAYDLATGGGPGGANTYVTFNDSGTFGGNASFTYNKTTNTISIGNTLVNSTVNSTIYTGTANNSTNFNGKAASFYANAENLTSGTVPEARLTQANATTNGIMRVLDSVVNTSILIAASANSVKTAYDAAIAANNLAAAAAVAGSNNYVQFNASGSMGGNASFTYNRTTNTISIGNTLVNSTINSTIYTGTANNASLLNGNSVNDIRTYADSKAATAYTNSLAYIASQNFANGINAFTFFNTLLVHGTLTVNNQIDFGQSGGTSGTLYANSTWLDLSFNATTTSLTYDRSLARWLLTSNGTTIFDARPAVVNIYVATTYNANLLMAGGTTAAKTGGGTWADSSDIDLKENLVLTDTEKSLDNINKLSIFDFDWKIERPGRPISDRGFIAQDFEHRYPHSISIDKNGHKMISLNFDFFADMVGAIQHLTKLVSNNTSRISLLEY